MNDAPTLRLDGLRVAIIEDELMIAMMIEDALEAAGCRIVGLAGRLDEALALIERERPEAATLDANLAGTISGPAARRLDAIGARYLVVTGYVEQTLADPDLAGAPRLPKPFTPKGLVAAATRHLGRARP
jgi:DNA-binding response OmpR family regulator